MQLSSMASILVRAPWPRRRVHQPPVGSFIAQPAAGPGQRAAWAADVVLALEKPAPLFIVWHNRSSVPTGSRVISGRAPEGSHLAQALPACGHRGGSPGSLGVPLGSTHGEVAPARRLPLGAQVPQSPHPLTSLHRSRVAISQAWGPRLRGTEVTSEA